MHDKLQHEQTRKANLGRSERLVSPKRQKSKCELYLGQAGLVRWCVSRAKYATPPQVGALGLYDARGPMRLANAVVLYLQYSPALLHLSYALFFVSESYFSALHLPQSLQDYTSKLTSKQQPIWEKEAVLRVFSRRGC